MITKRTSLTLLAVFTGFTSFAIEPTKTELDFFESKIRPIFADNCYKCHSPARGKIKGGLELDWKGGWETGGDSGTPIIPGDPEKSLLIKAVRYTDPDLQMPPKGDKLSAAQINDLVAWVKMGSPDPRTERPTVVTPVYGGASGKDHWSFKPVTKPTPPAVKNETWVKNDIDRFVLAKLEMNGMTPNDTADKRTLLRRVYYDLIGLPPTPEEVNAFLADNSPNAYEKVVDKLLASPRYGERWARHWLDVARYSDTKGQFDKKRESSLYPYAWTYRDYVIKAFNDDKPYDRFILEQLAADRINTSKDKSMLAALGFVTLGDHFNGNQSDIINDRIDVTSKAFLGLTVSCARCHDHKFDPIPTADYYSLHGIFGSSLEPFPEPEISDSRANPNYTNYLAKRTEMDTRLRDAWNQNLTSVFGNYKRHASIFLYATQMPARERNAYLTKYGADPGLLKNWEQISRRGGRQMMSIFGMWNMLSRIPEARFSVQAPRMLANLDRNEYAKTTFNPYVLQVFRGAQPKNMGDVATLYGNLFARNDANWQYTLSTIIGEAALRLGLPRQRQQYFVLHEQSDLLEMVHPGSPTRAEALVDSATPKDSPIFIRGQVESPGEIVPRRFLEILAGSKRTVFRNGSGRLELAQAIASKTNALTARVMVNRIWQHHFGEGFVTTPDDFGNQSEPPSHPELLDYLASRFMEDGWSIKKLHKQILMSATWQQGSQNNPAFAEKDPYNRLLWRANVRRLEFEPLRDSILYLGGNLDLTAGGQPVDLSEGTRRPQTQIMAAALNRPGSLKMSTAPRRTIYGYVDRGDVAEVLNNFDFANPSAPMGKRYETIVPQQALFLMNSPLVIEQVRDVVNRDEFTTRVTDEDRVRYLYELFYQRPPSSEEIHAGEEFIATFQGTEATSVATSTPPAREVSGPGNRRGGPNQSRPVTRKPLTGWQEYAHALLLANEASFVN